MVSAPLLTSEKDPKSGSAGPTELALPVRGSLLLRQIPGHIKIRWALCPPPPGPTHIKIRLALCPPPPACRPKYLHLQRGILWAWRFSHRKNQKSQVPIKSAQSFPALESRVAKITDIGLFLSFRRVFALFRQLLSCVLVGKPKKF